MRSFVLRMREWAIMGALNLVIALLAIQHSVAVHAATLETQGDPVLFRVGGDFYTLSNFRDFVLERPSLQGLLQSNRGIRRAVEEMIDSKVFKLAGVAQEIPSDDGGTETDRYYFAVQNRIVPRCTPPTTDDLEAFFDADRARFATPVLVRLSRVMLPSDLVVSGQPALDLLQSRKESLQSGALTFEALADEVTSAMISLGRTPGMMGDLGFSRVGGPEEGRLDAELLKASKGTIIGPFVDSDMVFLIQITDRRESVAASWPQIKDEVERVYMLDCRSRNLQAKRAELMREFNVELDENILRQIRPITDAPF